MIPRPRCPNSFRDGSYARFKMIGLAESPPAVATILRSLVGMNNCFAWATTAYGHQHCVEYELAGYRRSRRPPDDLSGEQIHDHSEVEPALPGANVCNIGYPSLVRAGDVEIALQEVGDQHEVWTWSCAEVDTLGPPGFC